MNKGKLIKKMKEILRTDFDLSLLTTLKREEIERLIACIRDRVDHAGGYR